MRVVKSTLKCKGQVAREADSKRRAHVVSIMRSTAYAEARRVSHANPFQKAKQHDSPETAGGHAPAGKPGRFGNWAWDLESGFLSKGLHPCAAVSPLGARAHLASEHSRVQLAQE